MILNATLKINPKQTNSPLISNIYSIILSTNTSESYLELHILVQKIIFKDWKHKDNDSTKFPSITKNYQVSCL